MLGYCWVSKLCANACAFCILPSHGLSDVGKRVLKTFRAHTETGGAGASVRPLKSYVNMQASPADAAILMIQLGSGRHCQKARVSHPFMASYPCSGACHSPITAPKQVSVRLRPTSGAENVLGVTSSVAAIVFHGQ